MNGGIDNEETLVRYLLGQLSEEERQHIEQRFFDDDQFYRRLLEVEDDLRCAYAQGTLRGAQKEQFEKRFLIFADERRRVELAREMITDVPTVSVERAPLLAPRRTEQKSGRWSYGPFFYSPAIRFATAAASLVVVAGLVWLLFETARLRNQLAQLQAERTATEKQIEQRSAEERGRIEQLDKQLQEERDRRAQLELELASRGDRVDQKPPLPSVVTFLLAPGRIRGGGETKRFFLTPSTEQIHLQLELAAGDSPSYQAEIKSSDGKEIWARGNLRARRGGARLVVSLTVPARLVSEDDYELKLTGLDASGQPERTESYYFTVLKK